MATEIIKILYATDLSPNSDFAFRYAVDIAKKYDSKIIILHVQEELPHITQALLGFYELEEYEKIVDKGFKERTGGIKDTIKAFCKTEIKDEPECFNLVSSIEISEGYPAEVILKKADELACDIIVMGSHGKGLLEYTFLGSITQKVLRRSKKPVFVIPLPTTENS
ncbi:universal stress protein [Thermodesulfobacteriota bacterium]